MATQALPSEALPRTKRIDYASTLSTRSKFLILAGVLLGLFLSALDQTIVSTALPRIVVDLQGIDLLAWVSTSYLLASTTMVPIYGKLSDIYGRKPVLLSGIVIFLLGSVLCGVAPSMFMLVVFRGLQGLGAAALTSTAFAIPADLFVPAERARYQGIFAAVFGLSSIVGPYIGGLITDTVGWRWVFYINLPLGLVALAFIYAKMPRMHSGLTAKIDYLGSLLLVVTVVPLLLGLTLDKTVHPWTSPLILGLFALAIVGLALFLWAERRAPAPILPLGLFRNRTFALVNIISPLVGMSFFAAVLFLSIYLVNVLGVSATQAGTAVIPLTLGFVFSSFGSSAIVQRTGRYKVIMLAGLLIMLAGFWWLTRLDVDTTLNMVRLHMVVIGIGMGPTMPILNLALQNAVPFEVVGAATASRQFFLQLGQALGAAVFGALLTATLTTSIEANLAPVKAQLPPAVAAQFDATRLRNGASGGEGGQSSSSLPQIEDPALAQQAEQGLKRAFTDSVVAIYSWVVPIVFAAFILTLFIPELPLRKTNREESFAPAME